MNIFNFDNTWLTLPGKFYGLVNLNRFENAELVLLNRELLSALDIGEEHADKMIRVFSGQSLHEQVNPFAQAYAGHQFGHFTMLGDGRAVVVGEHLTNDNRRFDIQLKGGGRTPYSRNGDGKATLKAMLREYLVSEAMHHLKIDSSRSLAVFKTGEEVFRETRHDGAVLARVMKSHIRIGTFEYASFLGTKEDLEALFHYTVNRLYPHLSENGNPALGLLEEVMRVQINLVTNWMRVGFIHGVMNTDNISISGETFDYGPCAFINSYHPQTVFSSIDVSGRYAFANQPKILKWNLVKFAQALLPLINSNETNAIALAQQTIDKFDRLWEERFYAVMADKLGIENKTSEDRLLVDGFLDIMMQLKLDYTNTFAALSFDIDLLTLPTDNPSIKNWLERWEKRIAQNSRGFETAKKIMKKNNPVFIPRNHQVEGALYNACSGDYHDFEALLKIVQNPYIYDPANSNFLSAPGTEFDRKYQTFCGT
jgi:serine/tyrosine/threonine adenylyltransferase